jgi:translation initiation factor IF-3
LALAEQRRLDLVEVAPNADPPVCRLMDSGKFLYEKARKEREARRAQKFTEIKGVRLRPKTADHAIGYKLKDARRFLEAGAKVRFSVLFRGRENTHPEIGKQLLDEVAILLKDIAVIEQMPSIDGRSMVMLMAPIKKQPQPQVQTPAQAQP